MTLFGINTIFKSKVKILSFRKVFLNSGNTEKPHHIKYLDDI